MKCINAAAIGSILLTACQTMQAPNTDLAPMLNTAKVPTVGNAETAAKVVVPQKNQAGGEKYAKLTPLSDYKDEWKGAIANGADFSGSYTKILVTGDIARLDGSDATLAAQPLPYEPRNWIIRSLVGREFSINLTAKVTIGTYEVSIPLATVGHQSNSDGEQWMRAIHHDGSRFPLFLVKTDGSASVPKIVVSVKAANTYASRGAAAAVGVAVQLAQAVSAEPPVVTKLTATSTTKSSQAVDAAISKLFGSGITEEHSTDRDLRLWSNAEGQPSGILITLRIPTSETDYNSTPLIAGSWRITFDFPRPSIFSDWRVCPDRELPKERCAATLDAAQKKAITELTASDILNYKLVNGSSELGTIRAFLTSQDWYANAITSFASHDTKEAMEAAGPFCRRIANEIGALGLNAFDAYAVVWATYVGMPVKFPSFQKVPDCNEKIVRLLR